MPTKSALIVDDSTTAQYRLKKMLRPFNLHIDVVDSGEAALRYLATNEPNVIFMDHLMPGMDGFRALQIIKSHPETAMIPVIMYTSKSGDVYTGQARALGALDVVTKDTINAADLSKVMEAIHIYRDGMDPKPPATDESVAQQKPAAQQKSKDDQADFIHAANKVSAIAEPAIERRIPNATGADQARNLELRLGHLEHTLEDSRRFITSRVVRELQTLRQSIKQELSEIISQNHAQPTAHPEVTEVVKVAPASGWSILGVALIIVVLVAVVLYFGEISQKLEQTQSQQQQISEQLKTLAQQNQNVPTAKMQVQSQALNTNSTTVEKVAENSEKPVSNVNPNAYVADLAWAFNQSAALQFNQNNIDPKVVIRLHEFLNRIINSGFKGSVLVNIYVGNFCVFINNLGQAQLPPETANMANCMLSSEVYGLDRVMKQYANEIEGVVGNLSRAQKKSVSIVINSLVGTDSYPERTPAMAAKDWNSVAQANNRLELRLDPASSQ